MYIFFFMTADMQSQIFFLFQSQKQPSNTFSFDRIYLNTEVMLIDLNVQTDFQEMLSKNWTHRYRSWLNGPPPSTRAGHVGDFGLGALTIAIPIIGSLIGGALVFARVKHNLHYVDVKFQLEKIGKMEEAQPHRARIAADTLVQHHHKIGRLEHLQRSCRIAQTFNILSSIPLGLSLIHPLSCRPTSRRASIYRYAGVSLSIGASLICLISWRSFNKYKHTLQNRIRLRKERIQYLQDHQQANQLLDYEIQPNMNGDDEEEAGLQIPMSRSSRPDPIITINDDEKERPVLPACPVCYTNIANYAFIPCGHLFCFMCAKRLATRHRLVAPITCCICRRPPLRINAIFV
jgi:hypothetical protein